MQQEISQTFRPVYMDQETGVITSLPRTINIQSRFDQKSEMNTILWSDIQIAFDNPLRILNINTIVPFLTDKNLEYLEPRRISCLPDVVLDVVVESPRIDTLSNSASRSSTTPNSSLPPYNESDRNTSEGPAKKQESTPDDIYKQGLVYYADNDTSRNLPKALAYFLKAACDGNVDAQHKVGRMYHLGEGTQKNYVKALHWYQNAANRGYDKSQNNLGNMYRNAQGVTQDHFKAMEWYEKAASQGNTTALYSIGRMYEDGLGVIQDYSKAVDVYRKAAIQGNASAQFQLGHMYHSGLGVTESYPDAAKWYKMAASQGHLQAVNQLTEVGAFIDWFQ